MYSVWVKLALMVPGHTYSPISFGSITISAGNHTMGTIEYRSKLRSPIYLNASALTTGSTAWVAVL